MAKPEDSPGFKKLLQEWNNKLKESGFRDIEEGSPWCFVLVRSGSDSRFASLAPEERKAREEYYELLSDAVHSTQFQDPVEEQMMTLYSQGVSQVKIIEALGPQGKRGRLLHRYTVYRKITKWLRAWNLK